MPRVLRPGYLYAAPPVTLSPGDAVRVGREVQAMTQAQLAAASGIAQATIPSIEHGRVKLGAERAKRLARALRVHPAVLLWPNWKPSADPDEVHDAAADSDPSVDASVTRARTRSRPRA